MWLCSGDSVHPVPVVYLPHPHLLAMSALSSRASLKHCPLPGCGLADWALLTGRLRPEHIAQVFVFPSIELGSFLFQGPQNSLRISTSKYVNTFSIWTCLDMLTVSSATQGHFGLFLGFSEIHCGAVEGAREEGAQHEVRGPLCCCSHLVGEHEGRSALLCGVDGGEGLERQLRG